MDIWSTVFVFDFSFLLTGYPLLLKGLLYTIKVTIFSGFFGICLALPLALMQVSPKKYWRVLASGYINFFRSVPLVQVLLVFYMLMPTLLSKLTGQFISISANDSTYVTFTVFEAAYFAEIIRAGILAIPKGQTSAAYALGMTRFQTMRLIVLPQAFHLMMPVLLTQMIVLLQDVSLVYAIGATDFFGAADILNQRDLRPVEIYTFVALVYFIICYSLSLVVQKIDSRKRKFSYSHK